MAPFREDTAAFEDAPLVLGAASSSMVLTLVYFSLFRHPLREEELLSYTHFYAISREAGLAAIRNLIDRGILESSGGLLCLRGDWALVKVRAEREARAEAWQPRVSRSIRTLSRLPFLRGLFISGSLSKGTQDPDGDIDFLVVTAPNRLWTARFFVSILLKLKPRAHRSNYCVNYFLSEDHLPIPDRTLFSATEIAFLKPALNPEVCAAFFEQNDWIRTFYPNWTPPEGPKPARRASRFQRLLEWPLAGALGDLFEARISRWYFKRIGRYMDHLPPGKTPADFRVGPKEYKGHDRGRHEQTQRGWHERVHRLEADLGIRLIRWPWAMTLATRGGVPAIIRPRGTSPRSVMPLKVTGRRALPPR